MIRLIAADIDGTLLNNSHVMTERTVRAIKEAQKRGVIFLISTGRMYSSARAQIEPYGIKCSYLCNSGAQIYDENGNLLRDLPMRPKIAHFIVEKFEKWKVPADIQSGKVFYMSVDPKQFLVKVWYFGKRRHLINFLRRNLAYRKTDGDVKRLRKPSDVFRYTETIYKISSSGIDPEKVVKMKEYFRKTGKVNAVSSFADNVEITDVNANKGSSVAWYAGELGIAPEDVMTIGDSDNDLSMIEWDFGYTVAMENGMDTVKQAAKFVTGSNDEDGVAQFIERYILE